MLARSVVWYVLIDGGDFFLVFSLDISLTHSSIRVFVLNIPYSPQYHNQIDRKFIIVAIKRLLARQSDRGSAVQEDGGDKVASSSIPVNKDTIHDTKTEDEDTASRGSFNWADQKLSDPNLAIEDSPPPLRSSAVALETIDRYVDFTRHPGRRLWSVVW